MNKTGQVYSVSAHPNHQFSKTILEKIELVAGFGVKGDTHAGITVKHRSRVKKDPHQPNLRQVHFIHLELLEEVRQFGFNLQPADLGENITTWGLDLLSLPRCTHLHIGDQAVVEVTGLRNPCAQIDQFASGLLKHMIDINQNGQPVYKAGIMGVVLQGGQVAPQDSIRVELPSEPHQTLERV